MSNQLEKWEVELGQTMKEHEFEFSPTAWEAMNDLLDEPVTAAGGEQAPADVPTPLIKIIPGSILGIFLIGIVLYWWLGLPLDFNVAALENGTASLSENSSVAEPSLVSSDSIKEVKQTAISQSETQLATRSNEPAQKIDLPRDIPTATEAEEKVPPENLTNAAVPATDIVALLPLKELAPVKFKAKINWPSSVNDPISTKRKRDRTTLFPDVIERY